MSSYNLQRFHDAHKENYDRALTELKNGKKETHWIWYIFPQLKGLGQSDMSNYYGLDGIEEARAYLQDSLLDVHLNVCLSYLILHKTKGKDVTLILGELDALKLKSCLTLFSYVDKERFEEILGVLFNSITCPATHVLLEYPPTRSLTDREKSFLAPYLKSYSSKYPPMLFYKDLSSEDKRIVRGLEKTGVLYPYIEEKPKCKLNAFNIFLLEVGYGLKLDSSGYYFE